MDKIYLTVKDTAILLNITERAVRLNVEHGKYEIKLIPGKGRGGKQYLIALDSLPEEAQERYKEQQCTPAPMNIFSEDVMKRYSIEQRDKAIERFNIIVEFKQSGLSGQAFIRKYNEEHSEKLSYRKLNYWEDKYNKFGIIGLIDKRGGDFSAADCMPPEVWDMFYSMYMTPQKLSVQFCYDKTKAYFHRTSPETVIPSYSTFTGRVRQIDRYAILALREGKKALDDKLPYMERDTSDLISNSCWISDHHLADVLVKNKRGQVVRPWITAFQDAKSRKIVACTVYDGSPNATRIKQALKIGITEYGIPEEIYVDNGKDYISSELDPDSANSVLNILGIHKRRAKPYHGQSKPIERFFKTLEDRFGKCFYSYIGSDGKKRPEHMKKTNKELEKGPNVVSIDEYEKRLANYIKEYNLTPHSGNGMDKRTPDEVLYNSFEKPAQMISDEAVLKLLFGNRQECKVSNVGVKVCSINFMCEELVPLYGRKVIAIYDPNDLDKVYIYTQDGKFVCQAMAKLKSPFRTATEEDFKRAAKERKRVEKLLKEYEPKRRKDEADILFANIAEEHHYEIAQKEEFENDSTKEAKKAVSEKKQEKKFNPFAEMYDISKKKGVI